jgi:hypothetical protein
VRYHVFWYLVCYGSNSINVEVTVVNFPSDLLEVDLPQVPEFYFWSGEVSQEEWAMVKHIVSYVLIFQWM